MDSECFLYKIEDLVFFYSLGKQKIEAIRGLSFNIPKSSLMAISGPSGSGKSTLLNILGLIEPVQEGKVLFLGEDIGQMGEKRKNLIRKFQIGFIFQHFNLIPILSVEENVEIFSHSTKVAKTTDQRKG